jgi:hypothetical protein
MIDPIELIAFDFAFGADRDNRQVDMTVGLLLYVAAPLGQS